MEVKFAFEIGQDVRIVETGTRGRVRGLYIDRDKVKTAYVEYFSTTNVKNADHFREDEIAAA